MSDSDSLTIGAMKKDVLIIKNLAAFEKLINRDDKPYHIDMMVMPGTLQDKHKDVDPEKGIPALRRQFNLVYLLTGGEHDDDEHGQPCRPVSVKGLSELLHEPLVPVRGSTPHVAATDEPQPAAAGLEDLA